MRIYLSFALLLVVTLLLNLVSRKYLTKRWQLVWGFAVPAIGLALFYWMVSDPVTVFRDFNKAYYPAGREIFSNPSDLYYEFEGQRCKGFVNMPALALFFTPLSFLSLPNAHLLFAFSSALIVVLSVLLMFQLTNATGCKRLAVLGVFAINGPLYYSIRIGNTTHHILFLLIAALLLWRNGKQFFSGTLIGLGGLFKLPLLLLGVYFLFRRQWKIVAGFASVILITACFSLILFGADLHLHWYKECIQPYSTFPSSAFNVQSLQGFLVRFLFGVEANHWRLLPVDANFKAIGLFLTFLVLGLTLFVYLSSRAPEEFRHYELEFCIAVCVALLISPVSWTHYYLLLLIPFSLLISGEIKLPKQQLSRGLAALSILMVSPPVIPNIAYYHSSNEFLQFIAARLMISHYFFGGLCLWVLLLTARRYAFNWSNVASRGKPLLNKMENPNNP